MKHASLFTGIGGFDLAAERAGFDNVFQVEINSFCQKVLAKNFPSVTKYKDIYEFTGLEYRGQIDVISAGFPCQPFSVAGLRKGKDDSRFIWSEVLRVICEIEPSWLILENVYGLLSIENGLVFEQICTDLENEGYEVQTFIIPAITVNAQHKRNRLWIIANANRFRRTWGERGLSKQKQKRYAETDLLPNGRNRWASFPDNISTPRICGGVDGIPNRMDRLKTLGNAIVPQIAYNIFNAINLIENNIKEQK